MTKNQFLLDFSLHNVQTCMYEWACSVKLTDEQWKEFEKLHYLTKWHIEALEKGDSDFSWQSVHDRGWLSEHAYKLFEKELKDAGVDVTKGKYGVEIIDGKYVYRPKRTTVSKSRPQRRPSAEQE